MSKFKTTHKQTCVYCSIGWCRGKTIEVDAAIAPLLQAMWRLGIATDMSCQGDDHEKPYRQVWIEFPTSRALLLFTTCVIAAQPLPVDPHESMLVARITRPWSDVPGTWEYEISVGDVAHNLIDVAADDWSESAMVSVSVSVRFPWTDYPAVLSVVEKAAAATARGGTSP